MPNSAYPPSVSERVIYHITERGRTPSGSSNSHSEDSWLEVEYDDDIEPSDSASRSRRARSTRHPVDAQPAVSRRRSSRRTVEEQDEDVPRRGPSVHSIHRHRSSRRESRHRRSHSRRAEPSDGSGSVASGDDYPYHGHHGMPRAPHPPQPAYRHVPGPSHGGYYGVDPYSQHALIQMRDSYGHSYHSNPLSPPPQHANPFSPLSTAEGSTYFAGETMGPRPAAPPRPQSFAGHMPYASELMYPPGFGGFPYNAPGYPWSQAGSPLPRDDQQLEVLKELLKQQQSKAKSLDPEVESQREMLKKLREDLQAQQKALAAEREEDIKAKAAARAKAIEDAKRKDEISVAEKKAKDDAEKKAEEAAKKIKEEHDKKIAEAEKAKKEADDAKKKAEEEIKKLTPSPDAAQAPIRFKDALDRKFSFPWGLAKSWKGMESLIRQAFMHIEHIGDHVDQGHYDLKGPDGQIILPQVWDTVIKPDWEVSMHMWPYPEDEKFAKDLLEPFGMMGLNDIGLVHPPKDKGKGSKHRKDAKKRGGKAGHPDDIVMVSGPSGIGDPFANIGLAGLGGLDKKAVSRSKSKGKSSGALAQWMIGGRPPPRKK